MKKLDISFNDIKRLTFGDSGDAISKTFRGINHRLTPLALNTHDDQYGLVFFTRPQLNLSPNNLRNDRRMMPLLTQQPDSYLRAIRMYLDRRLSNPPFKLGCKLVDEQNCFIPLLSNLLTNISGVPDISMERHTSKKGIAKEAYTHIDSLHDINDIVDITCTFRSIRSNPILAFFYYYTRYMSLVLVNQMTPYPDFLIRNCTDYWMCCYRLSLDHTKTYVTNINSFLVFPTAVPVGGVSDYSTDKPINESLSEISIPMTALGFRFNDPIIVRNFNKIVGIFNPSMRQKDTYSNNPFPGMQKVHRSLLTTFNHSGYPHINTNTKELEWYVFKEDYNRIANAYIETYNQLGTRPTGEVKF